MVQNANNITTNVLILRFIFFFHFSYCREVMDSTMRETEELQYLSMINQF